MKDILGHFKAGLARGAGFFAAILGLSAFSVLLAQTISTFQSGEVISSSSINANFSTLYNLITNRTLALSSGSGSFAPNGLVGTYTDVTNLSVSVTTNGNPLLIMIVPDSNTNTYIGVAGSTGNNKDMGLRLKRDGTVIGRSSLGASALGGTTLIQNIVAPPGAFVFYDAPAAGTYTYSIDVGGTSAADHTVNVLNCRLLIKYL